MTIDTERMIATLEANFDKYNKALSKLEGDTDSSFTRVETRGKKMESRLSEIGDGIKSFTERANTVLATIGVGIGLDSITAMSESIKKALDDVANIGNVAKQIGIGTDALQELRFAAQKADVPVGSLDQALVTFGTHISQIASGGGKGVADLTRILQANGVAVKDQQGNFRSTTDVLNDYANLIQNASSQQDRLRLATVAFGDAGASIVNVFSDGAAGLKQFSDEAHDLNNIISQETIHAAQQLNEQWDAAINDMTTKFKEFVVYVAENAHKATDWLQTSPSATGLFAPPGVTSGGGVESTPAGRLGALVGDLAGEVNTGKSDRVSQPSLSDAQFNARFNGVPAKPTIIPPPPATGQGQNLNAYQRLTQLIAARTKTLQAETAAQQAVNPFINDYGEALAEAKAKQDLLNAAEKAGVKLTPDVVANIDQEAKAYGRATAAQNEVVAAQEKLRKEMEDTRQLSKDVLGGFIEDMEQGKSAAEALGDALKKVGDKLLESGLNDLFGTSGNNNWFSSLFSSFFGGGSTPSLPDIAPIPTPAPRFAKGTNFAPGGAAIVGEEGPELVNLPGGSQVVPADLTRKVLAGGSSNSSVTVAPVFQIDARGAEAGVEERIVTAIKKADFTPQVVAALRNAKLKGITV